MSVGRLGLKIWFFTVVSIIVSVWLFIGWNDGNPLQSFPFMIIGFAFALVITLPALVAVYVILDHSKHCSTVQEIFIRLGIGYFIINALYCLAIAGIVGSEVFGLSNIILTYSVSVVIMTAVSLAITFLNRFGIQRVVDQNNEESSLDKYLLNVEHAGQERILGIVDVGDETTQASLSVNSAGSATENSLTADTLYSSEKSIGNEKDYSSQPEIRISGFDTSNIFRKCMSSKNEETERPEQLGVSNGATPISPLEAKLAKEAAESQTASGANIKHLSNQESNTEINHVNAKRININDSNNPKTNDKMNYENPDDLDPKAENKKYDAGKTERAEHGQETPQYSINTSNKKAMKTQNKYLIKGLIVAGLVLLLLIPTLLMRNLVQERQSRQSQVAQEVSSKWAEAQTLSGPFVTVPYRESSNIVRTLILPASILQATGQMQPEQRKRSIYSVLLYKSNIAYQGSYKIVWPADIKPENIDFAGAKLCFALSDYKGIMQEVKASIGGKNYELAPGLPVNDFGKNGLSVPITITRGELENGAKVSLDIKVKGSGQLHFLPLSGGGSYAVKSTWASPSFDGSVLPSSQQVSDSGFNASWQYNAANLPFGSAIRSGSVAMGELAFGVRLMQPADQYSKTERSVKYGFLVIGLSFGLIFITEIWQKKPFHPVQYVMVGLAMVIFYTLLLSLSEYMVFDISYLIAAIATVGLITFYTAQHFGSWKTGALFAGVFGGLYTFIFVIIRLEDTALLVGSIGLFVILAAVMYASKGIKWYGPSIEAESVS